MFPDVCIPENRKWKIEKMNFQNKSGKRPLMGDENVWYCQGYILQHKIVFVSFVSEWCGVVTSRERSYNPYALL